MRPATHPPLGEVAERALSEIARRGDDGVWITVTPRDRLLANARELQKRQATGQPLPLFGRTFAVKDNIDVAGLPTTAACPAFSYLPERDAPVVARLLDAGALCLGKLNLDQFASGLTGTRSPYGIPRNLFDDRFIVGGSSSGSAVAVAAGLVDFSLGTDTAGSGRVPAAFNNIVGLKPSRGLLSTTGVVPACPSLDCVSVFALTVEDAVRVAAIAGGYDEADPFSRPEADRFSFTAAERPPRFRFGVPAPRDLDFLGDGAAAEQFARAVERLATLGGERVELDFAPFRQVGALVYDGAFLAERLLAAGQLVAERPDALVEPVRSVLRRATSIGIGAALDTAREVARTRRHVARLFGELDFLLVPTTPTIFRIDDVVADPARLNAALGAFTTFVNPLDLAGLSVPTGLRADRLPTGATLVGPWGSDALLAAFGSALHRLTSQELGATGTTFGPLASSTSTSPPDWIPLAVLGAHLSGEPLNHQLTEGGGKFLRATRTVPHYRFYALPHSKPPKPGLARVESDGVAIDLEIWSLSPAAFGAFVARIPAPLCIGRIEIEDGSFVSGFLCEGYALGGARDISEFGGWRAYRRSFGAAT